MTLHKLNPGEQINASSIQPGDTIDYGNGQLGMVVSPQQEMGFGEALNSTQASGYKDIFSHYYGGHDWYGSKAASINRVPPFNLSFFTDGLGLRRTFENDPKEAMRQAEAYYRTDPIVGRTIELMAQFSIAGMRHQLENQEVKIFFDMWANQTGFLSVLHRAFLHYYLHCNVYILKTLVNFKNENVDPTFKFHVDPDAAQAFNKLSFTQEEMKELYKHRDEYKALEAKYFANQIDVLEMAGHKEAFTKYLISVAAKKNVWSKSMIPGSYTILDPKAITVHGPGDFGLGVLTYKISDELKKMVQDPTDVGGSLDLDSKHVKDQKKLILSIPKDILTQIKAGETDIILDSNYVCSIHRMKPDFEAQAYPLMTRAFKALHTKNRLREMDNATINNMISQMVIVKAGSDKHPATPAQITALANAYKDAIQTKSLTLIWNHTLEIERVHVDIDVLGSEKYKEWDDEIRDAFGVCPLLLGRVEGSSANAFMAVKGFMENLQQGRDDILNQFVYPEYHGIASAMGLPGYPEVVFDRFKLDDEASSINVLIKLVQTGILDYQTVVEQLGYDWAQTLSRHEQQAPLKDDGIIRLASPYNQEAEEIAPGTNSQEGGRPGGDGEKGGQPNSRPKNKNANPQKKVVK